MALTTSGRSISAATAWRDPHGESSRTPGPRMHMLLALYKAQRGSLARSTLLRIARCHALSGADAMEELAIEGLISTTGQGRYRLTALGRDTVKAGTAPPWVRI